MATEFEDFSPCTASCAAPSGRARSHTCRSPNSEAHTEKAALSSHKPRLLDSPQQLGGARSTAQIGGSDSPRQLVGPNLPHHLLGPCAPANWLGQIHHNVQLAGQNSPHQLGGIKDKRMTSYKTKVALNTRQSNTVIFWLCPKGCSPTRYESWKRQYHTWRNFATPFPTKLSKKVPV